MHYVMSDIHGEYDALVKMLDMIQFSCNDTLYILGDILDRGPKPIELTLFVMNTPNVYFCLGNHEDAFLKCMSNPNDTNTEIWTYWLTHGGEVTFSAFKKQDSSMLHQVCSFFQLSPRFFLLPNLILVHAGVNTNIEHSSLQELMSKQQESYILWTKHDFLMHPSLLDATIIFGHTPSTEIQRVRNEPITEPKIWKDTNRIGIDCALCFNGKLACIRLEDMQVFYTS